MRDTKEMVEVLRALFGLFVVAHGLVTLGIWAAPVTEKAPFNPSHSWLFGDARWFAVALALIATIAFVGAGAGFLAHQDWWAIGGVGGGAVALVLMGLYFSPWLSAGVLISGGVLYVGIQALQPI